MQRCGALDARHHRLPMREMREDVQPMRAPARCEPGPLHDTNAGEDTGCGHSPTVVLAFNAATEARTANPRTANRERKPTPRSNAVLSGLRPTAFHSKQTVSRRSA